MTYTYNIKSCSICPFFHFNNLNANSSCWLNDDNDIICFSSEEIPINCPIKKYNSIIFKCEE